MLGSIPNDGSKDNWRKIISTGSLIPATYYEIKSEFHPGYTIEGDSHEEEYIDHYEDDYWVAEINPITGEIDGGHWEDGVPCWVSVSVKDTEDEVVPDWYTYYYTDLSGNKIDVDSQYTKIVKTPEINNIKYVLNQEILNIQQQKLASKGIDYNNLKESNLGKYIYVGTPE